MQYIILDMEWNQPWPGSYSAKKALPSPMRGEIVQIGAVRMTQEQQVADEFQILIRPKYFKKMNRKVASLTGIRDSLLREKGVSFPEAAAQFAAWCGEDCVFLTWGFDDITILRENLAVFGLESGWTARWYNAQLIFNAQTDGSGAQKALSTAMQMMDIAPTRAAHDALGDAYHTALVCQKLRLAEGIAAYEAAVQAHENGFHGAELPGCVQRAVFHGYADKTAALGAMSGQENLCPVCGGQMTAGKWYPQQGRRYLSRARCEADGEFYIRIRLVWAGLLAERGIALCDLLGRLVDQPADAQRTVLLHQPPQARPRQSEARRPEKRIKRGKAVRPSLAAIYAYIRNSAMILDLSSARKRGRIDIFRLV